MIERYYKFIPENYTKNKMVYKLGFNADIIPFNPTGSCEKGGLYFSDIDNIHNYGDYGPILCEITLYDDSQVYNEEGKSKTDKFNIENIYDLRTDCSPELVQILNKFKNVDFLCRYNNIELIKLLNIKYYTSRGADWAARNGHLEVVKYLDINGIKCTSEGADWAAENGHLEVVKYLDINGIKCTSDGANWAAGNGHLEVVKWLDSNGIKCTSYGADLAVENGHLEVVKWLDSNGIKCTSRGAEWAVENGHLEVVKWLDNNGIKCT